jgi:hypothetical protein
VGKNTQMFLFDNFCFKDSKISLGGSQRTEYNRADFTISSPRSAFYLLKVDFLLDENAKKKCLCSENNLASSNAFSDWKCLNETNNKSA